MNGVRLLIVVLMLSSQSVLAGQFSIHTATTHFGMSGLENFTPGVAYTTDANYRVGALKNSYNIPSFYAAKVFDVSGSLRFGVGVVSGYAWDQNEIIGKRDSVIPLIALEKDITENLSLLWYGRAVNLEIRF